MRIEPKKIMCAIDFSDFSDMVVTYGKVLAIEFNSTLCLCHIVPGSLMVAGHISPYVDYSAIEAEQSKNAWDRLVKLGEQFDQDCEIFVGSGYPAEQIAQIARENDVDMVIAATYGGSGVKRFLIGSVTDRLVKILPCPLVILNPSKQDVSSLQTKNIAFKKILVGCDFSEGSQLAFDYALSLAQEFQTKLYLAHVVRPVDQADLMSPKYVDTGQKDYPAWNMADYMELKGDAKIWEHQKKKSLFNKLEDLLSNMLPKDCENWCDPIIVVLQGAPYKELIDYAQKEDVDMIVLGIHGHNLLETFLVGSTTDRVIRSAPCPVLAVRKPDEIPDISPDISSDEKTSVLTARDIMETNIIKISPDINIVSAAKILLKNRINGVPVVDDDGRLQGILCQSDLIFQQKQISLPPFFSMLDGIIPLSSSKQLDDEIKKIAAVNVAQAMVKKPVTAHLDMPVSEIASLMVEKHFHTIPVVDNDELVGIIGKEDILKELIFT